MRTTKNLEKEASLALSGAEYVKEKLIALSGVGPNSLYDQVYAIKIRVKSLDSLVLKVKEKKKTKSRQYNSSSVTDIVGMRLLCLYSEDLSYAVKSLVSFIRFCQSASIRLIEGEDLDAGIDEIRVYKSSVNARVYDAVYSYCQQLPLSEQNSKNEAKVEIIENDPTERAYSSVHFTCNCLSYASGTSKRIPLEIQVRTVFEDTWGEIDHSLEYKLRQRFGKDLPVKLRPFHKASKDFLIELKDHLDRAGSMAEKVKSSYQILYDTLDAKREKSKFRIRAIFWSVPYGERLPISQIEREDERQELEKIVLEAESLREKIKNVVYDRNEAAEIVEKIGIQIESIQSCLADTTTPIEAGGDSFGRFIYFLNMELGLLHIWKSQVLKFFYPNAVDEYVHELQIARDIYFSLEKENDYRWNAMLNFRLGCCMKELGSSEADFFLEQSVKYLDDDEALENSPFVAVIPHYLGYCVWKRRANLLQLGIRTNNPRISREDQRGLVLEALYFALFARHKLLKITSQEEAEQKRILFALNNNIISFVWEIRDLSKNDVDFRFEMDQLDTYISQIVDGYRATGLSSIAASVIEAGRDEKALHVHDTLMKYYHLTGDVDRLGWHRKFVDDILVEGVDGTKKGELDDVYRYFRNRISSREMDYALADPLIL